MFWRKDLLGNFYIAPILHTGEYANLKNNFWKNVEKGLVVVLCFCIFIFQISKRFNIKSSPPTIADEVIYMHIDEIPITKQGTKRPRPKRPVVPIPVEEPTVPEDLTIESTELDFNASPPNMPEGDGFYSIIPPRPIADVFPEYPEDEKKKGIVGEIELSLLVDISGRVQNVQVVKNLTGSQKCEQSAIRAAYQTRFIPARKDDKHVAVWIHKKYKFGLY